MPLREFVFFGLQRQLQAPAAEHFGQRVVVGQEVQRLGGLGLFGDVLQRTLHLAPRELGVHQKAPGLLAMGLRFAQKLDFAGVARAGISALGAWPSQRPHAAAAPGWRRAPLMQVVVQPGPGAIPKQVAPVRRAGHCAFAQHGP